MITVLNDCAFDKKRKYELLTDMRLNPQLNYFACDYSCEP